MAKAAPALKHRRVGFDDESVRAGFKKRPEGYKGRVGQTDIVRILTEPVEFYGARVEPKNGGKPFFLLSCAPTELITAEPRDEEALAKACPLFARGYDVVPRYAVVIMHVARLDSKGRPIAVNQILPWGFGADKYEKIRGIYQSLPTSTKTGKKISMRSIEIQMTCTDAVFQKIDMVPMAMKSQQRSTIEQMRELANPFFAVENDFNSDCELLNEFLEPDTKRELEKDLDRAEGKGKWAEESDEFSGDESDAAPAAKPGKKPGKRAPAVVEEEADPEVEETEIEDEEADGEEEEADEAPAPPPRRAAASARPSAKPAAKPQSRPAQGKAPAKKPAPAAEEEAADVDEIIDELESADADE